MPILFRYLMTTCLRYMAGLYFGFALLQIGQQVIAILEKLPNIELGQLGMLILLLIPDSFNDVAPVALVLAVLLTGNQLYSQSEIFILRGAGLSPIRINLPLLSSAFLVGLIMIINASYLKPTAALQLSKLTFDITNSNFTEYLIPGEFRELKNLGITVTASDNRNGQLTDVFIHNTNRNQIITGKRAYITNLSPFQYSLVIHNGSILTLAESGISQSDFESYSSTLAKSEYTAKSSINYLNSIELSKRTSSRSITELHWRLSRLLYCLSITAIALLFIPKSPRSGTSLAILTGVIMFFIFNDIANNFYSKAKRDQVNPQLVFWILYPALFFMVFSVKSLLINIKNWVYRAA